MPKKFDGAILSTVKTQTRYLFRAIAVVVAGMALATYVESTLLTEHSNIAAHILAVCAVCGLIAMLGLLADARYKNTKFRERFSAMIGNMKEGVIVSNSEGVVTQWNRAATEVFGLTDRQIQQIDPEPVGWRLTSATGAVIDRSDLPSRNCFATGLPMSCLIGVHKPDGELTWVQAEASPVFAEGMASDHAAEGAAPLSGVVTTYRDITAERNALDRFDLAMKAFKLGVWDWDVVDNTWKWDQALDDIFGQVHEKSKHESILHFVHPEDRERSKQSLELAMAERRDASLEFRIIRGDGKTRVLRVESKGFYSDEGTALRHVGVSWDITEGREQEIRAMQASKMSSLGEMSAGIAHEINNPLAIIIGKVESLREAVGGNVLDHVTIGRHIDVIEKTAQRIAKIVNSLRAFSRDGNKDPVAPTNVSELVRDTFALCHSRFFNHGIALTISEISPNLLIQVRAVEISQVLLNLLNNAFDVASELSEKWVRLEVSSDSEVVQFAVLDSGKGISPSVREKMTQPFFTTKEVGQGTGLGLSIATGIAQAHGGSLSVDTESLHTRIVLRIPLRLAERKFPAA